MGIVAQDTMAMLTRDRIVQPRIRRFSPWMSAVSSAVIAGAMLLFPQSDALSGQTDAVTVGSVHGGDVVERLGSASNTAWFASVHSSDLACLGDRVWLDDDGDGLQDATEDGVGSVQVSLIDSDLATIAQTTTDGDGRYAFGDLTPDTYFVQFVEPAGFAFTAPTVGDDPTVDSDPDPETGMTDAVILDVGDVDLSIDAGLIELRPQPTPDMSVGDRVWVDRNENGIQDECEPGVEGVEVLLLDTDLATITQTTTDGDGRYAFGDLTPDTYFVQFVEPAGFAFTAPTVGDDPTVDSDPDPATGITDAVILDVGDIDTSIDAGMTPLEGHVEIEKSPDQQFVSPGDSAVFAVTITNTGTAALFDVQVDDPVTPDCDRIVGTLHAGEAIGYECALEDVTDPLTNVASVTAIDELGNLATDSDSAEVWIVALESPAIEIETATNGYDADEPPGPPIDPGSTVNWTYLVTNTGDIDFDDLTVVDDHGVTVTCPQDTLLVGESITCTAQGTAEEGQYTNIGSVTGNSNNGLTATDEDPSHYLGVAVRPPLNPSAIGDTVWNDVNESGIQDNGERGIAGTIVRLTRPDGTTMDTTTDSNGIYLFTDLPPSEYTVELVLSSIPNPSESLLKLTTASSFTILLRERETFLDADFGVVATLPNTGPDAPGAMTTVPTTDATAPPDSTATTLSPQARLGALVEGLTPGALRFGEERCRHTNPIDADDPVAARIEIDCVDLTVDEEFLFVLTIRRPNQSPESGSDSDTEVSESSGESTDRSDTETPGTIEQSDPEVIQLRTGFSMQAALSFSPDRVEIRTEEGPIETDGRAAVLDIVGEGDERSFTFRVRPIQTGQSIGLLIIEVQDDRDDTITKELASGPVTLHVQPSEPPPTTTWAPSDSTTPSTPAPASTTLAALPGGDQSGTGATGAGPTGGLALWLGVIAGLALVGAYATARRWQTNHDKVPNDTAATVLGAGAATAAAGAATGAIPPPAQPRVFISYSRSDMKEVDRLQRGLEAEGISTWMDRGNISGGEVWKSEIVEGIRASDAVIIVLSPNSVESSNVAAELSLGRSQNKPVLPVSLKGDVQLSDRLSYDLADLQFVDLMGGRSAGIANVVANLRRLLGLPDDQTN